MSARHYRRGERVRNLHPMTHAGGYHPAGMVWEVMGRAPRGGYRLRAVEQCPHCGHQTVIPRVAARLLDPVP